MCLRSKVGRYWKGMVIIMDRVIKRLRGVLSLFTKITTLVVIVTAIYIMIFWGEGTVLGVKILWQIIFVSGICALGFLILPDSEQKEVSKASMLLRYIALFIYVNIVVMGSGIYFEWFYISNWKMILGMLACIVIVFVIISSVSYFVDNKLAEKMNEKL